MHLSEGELSVSSFLFFVWGEIILPVVDPGVPPSCTGDILSEMVDFFPGPKLPPAVKLRPPPKLGNMLLSYQENCQINEELAVRNCRNEKIDNTIYLEAFRA
jgi:hypothetical protein